MQKNQIVHGFKLVRTKQIDDVGVKMYEFYHQKSGANLVFLENDDTNKCFSVGFRTLPEDSTGICHIIEHSVLCGSDKYPLKEPFVNLLKGSMATFLNAMTAYDWTLYPVASQNDKDFANLVSVYMDACFRPLSVKDPRPFLQEGWHLEMHEADDVPFYKGVVYNEMKGAMSSVDGQLQQKTLEALYKGTPYEYNSGGEPQDIPNLTYQYYQAFYRKHYRPDNALFYLYGKLNIEEQLAFLDKEYLSKYIASNDLIKIEVPKALINLDCESFYAISEEEELKDNTYMALSYGLTTYDNALDLTGFGILVKALTGSNEAPLKKMMLDAKLGQDVDMSINDDNILPSFSVFLLKSNLEEKERFRQVFMDACQKLVKEGIDKKLLLATINNLEFQNKEMDMGRMPKGLFFSFNLMQSFNYGVPYENYLEYTRYFDYYKGQLDKGYFEGLLEKFILNSKHYVQVVLKPSKTLAQEKAKALNEKMVAIKGKMTDQEINDCLKMNEELLAYQNKKDTQEELQCLPSLSLDDISPKVNTLPTEITKVSDISCIKHEFNTNKIGYFRMFFDLNVLKYEEIQYVKLLTNLLANLDTESYPLNDLQSYIKTYLGNLSFTTFVSSASKDECVAKLVVNASALTENVDHIRIVLNEILMKTIYDEERLHTMLLQLQNMVHNEVIENGMRLAMDTARSTLSKDGALSAKLSGLQLYRFFKGLSSDFNAKQIIAKLKDISNRLFNVNNVMISLSGEKETILALEKMYAGICLNKTAVETQLHIAENEKCADALVIPSEVNYNAKAINLKDLGVEPEGKLRVVQHLLNYDYLWPEVRVKGGAYGCQLSIYACNDIVFGSYRDPNVANTYNVYDTVSRYLESLEMTEEEFNSYLIGAIATFDQPASNTTRINTADANYLLGITDELRQKRKQEMLDTKLEDIKQLAELFKRLAQMAPFYTIGNEEKIKECPQCVKVEKL